MIFFCNFHDNNIFFSTHLLLNTCLLICQQSDSGDSLLSSNFKAFWLLWLQNLQIKHALNACRYIGFIFKASERIALLFGRPHCIHNLDKKSTIRSRVSKIYKKPVFSKSISVKRPILPFFAQRSRWEEVNSRSKVLMAIRGRKKTR